MEDLSKYSKKKHVPFKERFTKLFPQPETKDFEWKDDMKLFDKKIEVAVPQPEPEESQAKLWANAKALSDPWKYFEIQRKKQ